MIEQHKAKQACRDCMIAKGYKHKDKGYHTAVMAKCDECGEVKPIRDRRHWVRESKA